MPSSPLVSVIIPCYNAGRFLAEAIDSALAQTYPNIEVIVVNDGSTDKTAEVAAGYGDRIRYVYQENAGLSAARNTGIHIAAGEYLQFLDADDRLLPEKIEKQMKIFEKDPELGAVYCHTWRTSESGEKEKIIHPSSYRGDVYHVIKIANIAPLHTFLIQKKCIDMVGEFNGNLKGIEDWDMWIRIALYYHMDNHSVLRELLEGGTITPIPAFPLRGGRSSYAVNFGG